MKPFLRDNGLSLLFGLLFLGALVGQAVAGQAEYNNQLQDWQSEFLAIGSMAVFSGYLRQRGSPESKPVGAAHVTTDESGQSGLFRFRSMPAGLCGTDSSGPSGAGSSA